MLRSITEATFLLTKDEAAALEGELTEVLHRWTARSRASGEPGGEGRDVYALLQILQPRVPDEGRRARPRRRVVVRRPKGRADTV
ncbi:hypothetical protein [Nocardioides zeae]